MKTLECSTAISFRNILFLTDFTSASDAAFTYAVALARHFAARLYAAHAVTPYLPAEMEVPIMPDIISGIESERQTQLSVLVKKTGVSNTVLVTHQDIEVAVPNWIKEHGIDLIVMGTHGRKGMDRFFLGSTSEAIVRTATCPVLTVGPGVKAQPRDLDIKRVLFATSLTKENDPAVAYALSFARERSANLTVLHALPDPAETQEDWEALADIARDKMKALVPVDDIWPRDADFIVEPGDASLRILEYAEDRRPGLIVLGLSKAIKPSTHFRRGVAYKVISSAPCAVLTVR